MDYTRIYPTLDLHGEYSFSVGYLIDDFIKDNICLKNKKICIMHGIGEGIVKKSVNDYLKKDKRVKSYKTDIENPGYTIIELKEELWEN